MSNGLAWNYIKPTQLSSAGLIAPNVRTAQAGLSGGIQGLQQIANSLQPRQSNEELFEKMVNEVNNAISNSSSYPTSPVNTNNDNMSQPVTVPQSDKWFANKIATEAATPYIPTIQQASKTYGVPEDVMLAVIQTESGFKPNAVSPTGVKGLMQVTQDTYKGLGFTGDRADPTNSINAGAKLLSQLYSQYGNWDDAFAAYNGGSDAVKGLKEGNWGIWANNPNKQKEIMQYASTVNNYRIALNR